MTNTRIRWYHINGRARCPINFTQPIKRFILSLHNNGSNSFLFVNATKLYQVKVKGSKIKDCKLCLGNVWKDFTINKMKKKKKKTGLKGIVIFFLLILTLLIQMKFNVWNY